MENGNYSTIGTRETRRSAIEEQKTLREVDETVTSILVSKEVEVGSRVKSIAEASANGIEVKSLVMLQVNCRTLGFK